MYKYFRDTVQERYREEHSCPPIVYMSMYSPPLYYEFEKKAKKKKLLELGHLEVALNFLISKIKFLNL